MASLRHTRTPVHHPRHILILLPVRWSQIYERSQTVPIEKHSDLVQCHPSVGQHSSRVGGRPILIDPSTQFYGVLQPTYFIF